MKAKLIFLDDDGDEVLRIPAKLEPPADLRQALKDGARVTRALAPPPVLTAQIINGCASDERFRKYMLRRARKHIEKLEARNEANQS